MNKTIKYHDDFMQEVIGKINEIAKLKAQGKFKEAAQVSYDLAKAKVDYYEQFVNDDEPTSNYKKIHEDDYISALKHLSVAIDDAYEYGILKD